MEIKLAEALLRRKELQEKVDQLRTVQTNGLFEVRVTRKQVHEGIDDVLANIPKLSIAEVTAAYDFHAKRLRRVDASIQQANWNTVINIDDTDMDDYKA